MENVRQSQARKGRIKHKSKESEKSMTQNEIRDEMAELMIQIDEALTNGELGKAKELKSRWMELRNKMQKSEKE